MGNLMKKLKKTKMVEQFGNFIGSIGYVNWGDVKWNHN